MTNLQTLTLEQLTRLKADVQSEIDSREAEGNGFDKEFELDGKAYRAATKRQADLAFHLAKKTGSEISVSISQICLRMDVSDMSDAIELMSQGKRIRIYQ